MLPADLRRFGDGGVVRFQIGFAARVDLQRAIGPWPLAGLAEPAGAALKLSTVLHDW